MFKAINLTTILGHCHVIWEPQLPGTLWVSRACIGTDLPLPLFIYVRVRIDPAAGRIMLTKNSYDTIPRLSGWATACILPKHRVFNCLMEMLGRNDRLKNQGMNERMLFSKTLFF